MLSESVRQRLEALNRQALPTQAAPVARPAAARAECTPTALGEAIVEANELGEHVIYHVPVEALWAKGPELVMSRHEYLRSLCEQARVAIEPTVVMPEEMTALVDALPERAVMLDLETCGFSGAALFLVGLLRAIDGCLTVELLLARHYGEEQAVLATLWRRLARADVLVTFNGKSFDWPTVMDRSRRHLLHKRFELREPRQVDVLHHARRKWRRALPDCRLQTIERLVCRRARGADIPGAQIPAAYDAYVRTGRDDELRLILHHNALDLVTLLDVTMRVAG